MTDRSGIFAGDDPFEIARAWMAEAAASEPSDPDAAALATVDAEGLPDVRIVLVRQINAGTFTFFTNYTSAKGRELTASGKAALNFHWKSLRRQIRVRGRAEKVSESISDEYFGHRHPVSRIGAWASNQSTVLENRAELEKRVETIKIRYGDNAPRPPHWGGFAIIPTQIEFWSEGPNRLHDRFQWLYSPDAGKWIVSRLNP